MILGSRIFIGRSFAKFYYFYHFLPVFVLILIGHFRLFMQFAFDFPSQPDLQLALADTLWSWKFLLFIKTVIIKFLVVWCLAWSHVVVLAVNLRLMMDTLPTGAKNQHPKLNKNFRAFLSLNQRMITHSACLSNFPSRLARVFRRITLLLILSSLCWLCWIFYNKWGCSQHHLEGHESARCVAITHCFLVILLIGLQIGVTLRAIGNRPNKTASAREVSLGACHSSTCLAADPGRV